MAPHRKWLVLFHLHFPLVLLLSPSLVPPPRNTCPLAGRPLEFDLFDPCVTVMRRCARQERCFAPLCESECVTRHLLFSQHHFIRCRFSSQAMVCIAALLCADWCGIWATQSTRPASPRAAIQNRGHVFGLRLPSSPIFPAPWRALVVVVVALVGHVRC